MKRRKTFLRRHIIAITFLIMVAIYSAVTTVSKFDTLSDLRRESEAKILVIEKRGMELKTEQYELSKVGELDFVEKYARENFRMVKPNEVYFEMMDGKEE